MDPTLSLRVRTEALKPRRHVATGCRGCPGCPFFMSMPSARVGEDGGLRERLVPGGRQSYCLPSCCLRTEETSGNNY
ncbi:hypothetical protein NDU88_008279 [Pleurodeles waltl]|uniref:Uncharacterized protein n=1 Tax=Pleurodeles waltl TaxID=8319 RepID=A0AAV7U2K0_PLEWA|nr:hypothetical protein NDU88_008279 [Pleurodeles waltl]